MNLAGTKRKSVDALKCMLIEWGFPTSGKKAKLQQTVDRVEAMKSLADQAAIDHHWTKEEIDMFFSGLPIDEYDQWQPHEVHLVQQLVNTRFIRSEVLAVPHYANMVAKIAEYCQARFAVIPRVKTQTVVADSLAPLFKLLKKNVEKWNDADGDLLLRYLGNVAKVDGRNSSTQAVEKYCELLGKLAVFYARRPDIKAKVDPELVIFDLSAKDVVVTTYVAQLAVYPAPPHFGAMPGQLNPGPVGTVFPMGTIAAANHFVGWMMARVPGLRALIQPGAPGGVLTY
eukprot:gene28244-34108_t